MHVLIKSGNVFIESMKDCLIKFFSEFIYELNQHFVNFKQFSHPSTSVQTNAESRFALLMNAIVLQTFILLQGKTKTSCLWGEEVAGAANGLDFEQAAEIEQAAANILAARFQLFANDEKALKTNEVRKANSGEITLC